MRWTTGALGLLALIGACGGDGSAGDTGTAPGTDGEPVRFDALTDAEKAEYMASHVLPTMAAVFQGYDAEAYADFSCATCHVTGLADGSYAMPDPGLPKLREDAFPYTSEVGLFMEEEVLPTLKDLLGPTPGGRPCVSCHTLEEEG